MDALLRVKAIALRLRQLGNIHNEPELLKLAAAVEALAPLPPPSPDPGAGL